MKKNNSQKGSALVYILIAIALLAALTATFMNSSSQQTSSQNAFKLSSELKSQADMIRSAIQECVLLYPGGDNALAGQTTVGGQTPVHPYPLIPLNTYLSSPVVGTVSNARDIRCPGNPGNSNNHAKIFAASSGKFLPAPPSLFEDWRYYNNTDGVFIFITSEKTDAYIQASLQKLDSEYSKCESQYVDARSGDVNLAPGWVCSSGKQCFRLWILAKPSAIYPGETGCP